MKDNLIDSGVFEYILSNINQKNYGKSKKKSPHTFH